jgi:O-antigen ligase
MFAVWRRQAACDVNNAVRSVGPRPLHPACAGFTHQHNSYLEQLLEAVLSAQLGCSHYIVSGHATVAQPWHCVLLFVLLFVCRCVLRLSSRRCSSAASHPRLAVALSTGAHTDR